MSIEYAEGFARFSGNVAVDDAEGLLQWLQEQPDAAIDLAACRELHTACLQMLMAARARVIAFPEQADAIGWLRSALPNGTG